MSKKYYNVHEAAEALGYGHIESFRRAVRSGWLAGKIHPVKGSEIGWHAHSLAYPVEEVDANVRF